MSHNKQVTANIRKIKEQVEQASGQQDLVELINEIKGHPGPLDYDDRLFHAIKWAMVYICTIGLFQNYVFYGYYSGDLGYLLAEVLRNSSYLAPALFGIWVGQQCEKRNKRLPLPRFLARPWLRIGLIALGCVAVTAPFELWHQGYWFCVGNLIFLASGGGRLQPPELVTLGLAIVIAGLWFWLRKRQFWRDPVSDRIHLRDRLFNNGLTPVTIDKEAKAKELERQFREFDRGNYRREIMEMYQGHHQGDIHSFDFQVYKFHYVDKRTETYTDSEGKTKTRTTYDHYYRHGLLLQFPYAKSIAIDGDRRISYRGEKYTTASNEFNRHFRVRAKQEMTAARLLTPAVVELLSEFGRNHKRPIIEVNGSGYTCIAFDDRDLLTLKRQFGLDKPDAFAEEIAAHAELKKLTAIKTLVHHLMRLSDNNFA
ncbi:Protein of unknown function [Ferrimonas sediminum]|uniref:Uncharacterized protein n=1 Tax=Ferrimonas sediminum TaxID=718193 RepID=A0A1G8VRL8_9GAMM|nr:DUF3137 domain-containing protein [Ferrimonas sediminum]SDJ67830.1 Protein of unknown function [Ferrimonas sediminum]